MREKPRELTGPFENPVRRWVRLREKARQFSELPPPRQIPVPKPARKKFLEAVEGVPRVSPKALNKRLEFLLSPLAVEQQLSAPLRPGCTPYYVESVCWQRQMRDLRRVYRAQYLQKLAEVTEIEREREMQLHDMEIKERKRRKQEHLRKVGEDMKRRAILADRKRIEAKVNEAVEMARRSKAKRVKLFWLRRLETMSKLVVSDKNLEDVFAAIPTETFEVGPTRQGLGASTTGTPSATGALLSRNVSVPFLLRQLGGATGYPQQKAKRLPHVDNIQREILESSYELLDEDAPRFEPLPPDAPSHRQRAAQLYSKFSPEEKERLLQDKIIMLQTKIREDDAIGKTDAISIRLLAELEMVQLSTLEGEAQRQRKSASKTSRGSDPEGLP